MNKNNRDNCLQTQFPVQQTHDMAITIRTIAAGDANILAVGAVVHTPASASARRKSGLSARARHIIQPDLSSALSERCTALVGAAHVSELTACHGGISVSECIVTHSTPNTIVVDLKTSFIGAAASNKTESTFRATSSSRGGSYRAKMRFCGRTQHTKKMESAPQQKHFGKHNKTKKNQCLQVCNR